MRQAIIAAIAAAFLASAVVPARCQEPAPSGDRPSYSPRTVKVQINFARAEDVARDVLRLPTFAPSTGIGVLPQTTDNTLLVTGTDQQILRVRDAVRLMDILPRPVAIKVVAVVSLAERTGRRHAAVMTVTGRTVQGRPVILRTTSAEPAQAGEVTVPSGKLEVGVTPHINGDNSISMDTAGGVDLTYSLPGGGAPIPVRQSADGQSLAPSGGTVRAASATVNLGSPGAPAATAEVSVYLTPQILPVETSGVPPFWGGVRAVIVADFVGREEHARRGGAAADAVAKGLEETGRFEVLPRSEVAVQVKAFGFKAPCDWPALAQIAYSLGASAVITGEIAEKRRSEGVISAALRDVATGDLMAAASAAAGQPGLEDTVPSLRGAARMVAYDLASYLLPEATVLLATGRTVLLGGGLEAGLRRGMTLAVMHDGARAGRLKVARVGPTTADAIVLESRMSIVPGDRAHELLPDRAHPGPTPKPVTP